MIVWSNQRRGFRKALKCSCNDRMIFGSNIWDRLKGT